EKLFRRPLLVAAMLISFALILVWAEKISLKKDNLDKLTWQKVIFIGFAQILALIPGVSRAGITMTAGLFCGLKREAAARFSFLLATPIMLAAALYKLKDLFSSSTNLSSIYLWVGFLTATITGFLAIKFLINFLKKQSFFPFVWYRIILGLIIIFLYVLG
ncbi:MAG: undecaprenyl-diphosphate phosphatase, partial [Candidatus Margulisbacteria bacterium]|nr:undecaprenyl-diphosphate phosphatase [Candidatus Margulisiibacteriota bacterium]